MNNPFDYEPSAEMLEAQKKLVAHIESLCNENPAFKQEISKGKMFGILRVDPLCFSSISPSMGRTGLESREALRQRTELESREALLPIEGEVGRGSLQRTGLESREALLPIEGEVGRGSLLFAFSGQICGKFNWPGFVPAVFDYLDEDGYFKIHEREITEINNKIDALQSSKDLISAQEEYDKAKVESNADIEEYRRKMKAAKFERDLIRGKGVTDETSLIRESQFMKAELHRKKLYWKEQLETAVAKIKGIVGEIRSLKLQRQQKSDALQRWLFEQFVFTNPQTEEKKNLLEIFDKYYRENGHSKVLPALMGGDGGGSSFLPPSGSGECCEPKLLHYAIEHNLEPVEIGMFWWGDSPKQEIRHHLQFYPACSGKCKPILETLFPAFSGTFPVMGRNEIQDSIQPLPCGGVGSGSLLEVFQDNFLLVVNKPSGMLSVPGRSDKPSVFSILKERHPDCSELQMVHRLDMDTSGLLVVAKTKEAHKNLQRQFAEHTIKKEYIALLSHPSGQENGTISLPIRPDYEDRPRQIVDKINGKTAITKFSYFPPRQSESSSFVRDREGVLVRLYPLTGRTHQLRVHCAHKDGLNNPIKGDRLYGRKAERLYLHAAYLEFTHPVTGERMKFRNEPNW